MANHLTPLLLAESPDAVAVAHRVVVTAKHEGATVVEKHGARKGVLLPEVSVYGPEHARARIEYLRKASAPSDENAPIAQTDRGVAELIRLFWMPETELHRFAVGS